MVCWEQAILVIRIKFRLDFIISDKIASDANGEKTQYLDADMKNFSMLYVQISCREVWHKWKYICCDMGLQVKAQRPLNWNETQIQAGD